MDKMTPGRRQRGGISQRATAGNAFRTWVVLLLVALAPTAGAQVYEGRTLVEAQLVADTSAIVPGKPFRVGLLLKMAPGWHTYWQNPGDAGVATSLNWELPEGFGAGPLEWPLPKEILEPGDILVYAYKDEVLLMTVIQPPASLEPGTNVTLKGKASWLVCAEVCIPGKQDLELSLPVSASAEPANSELFALWDERLPSADAPPFAVEWAIVFDEVLDSEVLELTANVGEGVDSATFFPLPTQGQEIGRPVGNIANGVAKIRVPGTGDITGLLVVSEGDRRKGWMVTSSARPSTSQGAPDLLLFLAGGVLGGLILNLMPCVLPVISLKIFGFVRQAGDSPRSILLHGLAFAGGIFVWFLGLGLLIVILKSTGNEATWAFQFQNPIFNIVVATIVFAFALNLLGVFEVTLPGRASGTLADLSGKEGLGGSFFQGIFATLLATPCTGPFLGSALGIAFGQGPAIILAMFAAVAFGMALPYLILSARPGWMKFLPKPGAWMERLKQFMAFPLFATLLWLLQIISAQLGAEAVIAVGAFLLCVGLACWIYGSFCGPANSMPSNVVSACLAVVVAVLGGWFFLSDVTAQPASSQNVSKKGGIDWVPFSTAEVARLREEGKPVFVDFTAEWCITCKFNERTAIDRPAVIELIQQKGIVPVKADWTNANPEITAALAEFGRVGVPFYVLYPPGNGKAVTFPEVITEQMVLDAFGKL